MLHFCWIKLNLAVLQNYVKFRKRDIKLASDEIRGKKNNKN